MIETEGVGRERRIVETVVELSDTRGDVVDLLHRLVLRSVEFLNCVEAGLLLHDGAGALRVIASSGEGSEAFEVLQIQNEGGPSQECVRTGAVVSGDDLAAAAQQWDSFARLALFRGFRSVQAIPMRVHGETIGALNLFRAASSPIAERDTSLAQGMADVVAVALTQDRALRRADDTAVQLQRALTSRVVIEQAKGVLAARTGLDVEAAFHHLRTYARRQNRQVADIARVVVDGGPEAEALIDSAMPLPSGRWAARERAAG